MSLTCQVRIVLNRLPEEKAETVKKALEPDNVDFPKGLSLSIENTDDGLVFDFRGKNNIRQLTSTVDEVMEHIQVALRVIE